MPVFTESKKGYDKEEVNAFIKQLNEATEARIMEKDSRIKELEDEIKRLSKKTISSDAPTEKVESDEELENAKKKYQRLCADMGEKLLLAEVKASEIIDEANAKAEKIIADARLDANKEVEEILEDAKLSSEGIKKAVSEYSAMEKEILALLHTTEETFSIALERISGHIYKGKE
jgi:cell division septum initiation protein DivIVA